MNWANLWFTLLANETDRLGGMARGFRPAETSFWLYDVLVVLSVVAAIGLVFWGVSRVMFPREPKLFNKPNALFRELCRAHKLKMRQRWLLWRLAHLRRAAQPAAVFLNAELYDESSLPAQLRPFAGELSLLQRQLFAAPSAN